MQFPKQSHFFSSSIIDSSAKELFNESEDSSYDLLAETMEFFLL